jgi:predicted transcriptional regulator YdeE
MKTLQTPEPMLIVGLPLRTDNERAFRDIPAHWERFSREGWLGRIPGRAGDDVYAVYTHFSHEGVDNQGEYSLVVGAKVDAASAVPEGLASVIIPASRHAVFEVEAGRPDKVGERWIDVWADQSLARTHVCDHEHYHPNGHIDICVGVR